MSSAAVKPASPRPSFYAWMLPELQACARERGYCLAMHGSMARDFDLIAVPWTVDAVPAVDLVEALRALVQDESMLPLRAPDEKPHGRRAWSIPLGGGPYLDVSVVPLQASAEHSQC
jgi:hypothetical protein